MAPRHKSLATPPGLQKRPQMADIARLAGVSTATVSRALSGSDLIPEATRQRIHELARSLNYHVNVGAANLRKQKVKTVGVVILGDSMQAISDPFILHLIGTVADALDTRGYNVLLSRLSGKTEDQVLTQVATGQVCGLIVIGQYTWHAQLNQLVKQGTPVSVWGAALDDALYPVVGGDNEHGGYLATQHLIQQGCRRIAFLGDISNPEAWLRHQGYLRAYQDLGVTPDPAWTQPVLFGEKQLNQVLTAWLDQGQTLDGVFAISDVSAITVMGLLNARGMNVPRDIKVVGYDDIEMSSHVHPGLTTVRQPVELAGPALVEHLFQLLEGQAAQNTLLPATLVIRESSI